MFKRNLIVLLAVALAVAGCRKPRPSSVLLITVESLRAGESTGPNMRKLKGRGTYFTEAFSPSPVTFPAMASIMTGKHPLGHGVLWNYDYALGEDQVTLAEAFQTHNLRTSAQVGASSLDPLSGMEQGFDTYGYNFDSVILGLLPTVTVRSAGDVSGDVSGWVAAFGDKPFFMWAHFADLVSEDIDRAEALENIDDAIGKLIAALPDGGREALVVLTSPAADSTGSHGEEGHGIFLYDDTVRVPLMIAGPGVVAREVNTPASLQDVLPTVLSYMGLPLPQGVQGSDLSYVLRGGNLPDLKREWALVTREPYNLWGWSPLTALRTDQWKYIRAPKPELYDLKADPEEKSNLAQQRTDTVSSLEGRLVSIEKQLTNNNIQNANVVEGELPDPKDRISTLPLILEGVEDIYEEKYQEALVKLEEARAADPENRQTAYLIARALEEMGETEKSLPYLEEAAGKNPDDPIILATLGEAYMTLGTYDKAMVTFEKALALQPTLLPVYQKLGFLYQHFSSGLTGEAKINALQKALYYLMIAHRKMADRSPHTLFNIGAVSLELGQELQVVEQSSTGEESGDELGFSSKDLIENATRAFSMALEEDPELSEAYFMLGQIFSHDPGKRDEAVENLKKFLELAPGHKNAKIAKTLLKMLGE